MKKLLSIFSILAIVVLFDSCKKQNTTPTPVTQSTTSSSTTSTTPTPTTSVNDTIGKTKIAFGLSLIDVITSPLDYKYDTLNTRIRLNHTYLSCTKNITPQGNLTGLSRNLLTAIWMGSGDSLIVEVDSLEYNDGTNHPFNDLNGVLQIYESYYNNSGVFVTNMLTPIPLKDYTLTAASTATDHSLGFGVWNNGSNPATTRWYVGKRTRIIYVRP